jgi:D-alanyl-D-alanine carboxypeptidase
VEHRQQGVEQAGTLQPGDQTSLNPSWAWNPAQPDAPQYGLAIAKFGALYGHTGEVPGFNTFAGTDPQNKVTIVVWVNLDPTADGRAAATLIAKDLIEQMYSPRTPTTTR